MRVLITGGSGFIGRHLVEGLRGSFDVDAPATAELDLLDTVAVGAYLRKGHFEAVVHAATWDATRTSGKDPGFVLENSLRMFHNLARERAAFTRLVNLGSGAEYDRGRELLRVREDEFDRVVPSDQYGYAKYLMRKHCELTPGLLNLSLFGVFGSFEDWRLRFLSNACCHAVFDLPIEVGRDALFDYIAVEDVAEAVSWCLRSETEEGSFNVCSGEGHSLVDLAHVVRAASGKDLEIVVRRPGRGPAYVGDPAAFERASGWRPSDMPQRIASLYAWYDDHRDNIDSSALLQRRWSGDRGEGPRA
ncbi:MAG: NAD(P)-dependent oxidoreductase [Actinomycetes bacterium]